PEEKGKGKEKDQKPSEQVAEGPDITNLLPNDSKVVVSIPMGPMRGSAFNAAALDERGAGFREEKFRNNFGFDLSGIKRVVMALNPADKWVFTVVRTKGTVKPDQLKSTLKLEPQPKVKGKGGKEREYFLIRGDLDSLSNL